MYTNAQVAALVTNLDARIARIEAALVAGTPAQASASTTVVPAAQALAHATPKVKVSCTLHDKHFALTPAGAASGSGFHFGWCKGSQVAVA